MTTGEKSAGGFVSPSEVIGAIALMLLCIANGAAAASWPAGLPVYDHVVVVIEENKDFEQIFPDDGPNRDAPFITQLAKEGALFTKMFGEEHNSQGNYFWLFSGARPKDLSFLDDVPKTKIAASNLGQRLIAKGLSLKAYSEDLPAIGSEVDGAPLGCKALSRQLSADEPLSAWRGGRRSSKTTKQCGLRPLEAA